MCPDGWEYFGGRCFKKWCKEDGGDKINYKEAQDICTDFSGHLAVPTNSAMDTWIFNLHKQFSWIGLSDEESEGNWIDRNGETAKYLPWINGVTNGGTNQNCAYQHGGAGIWDDGNCKTSTMECAVCEHQCPAGQELIEGVCKGIVSLTDIFYLV